MTLTTKLLAAGFAAFALVTGQALASDVSQDRAQAIAALKVQGSHKTATNSTKVADTRTHGERCNNCCAKR